MRILLAEDDPTLQRGLVQALHDAGHVTMAAGDGQQADLLLLTESFDLLVLDLGLPKMDGLIVLERMRRRRQTLPVLILSARDETADRVLGLNRGADDYLTKPFELSEFDARVRALLRRGQGAIVQLGSLEWSWEIREAAIDGLPVKLTRHEASLLEALIRTPARTIAKHALALLLGENDLPAEDNLVEVYVSRLRRKIDHANLEIRTVRGFGYRLQQSPADDARH